MISSDGDREAQWNGIRKKIIAATSLTSDKLPVSLNRIFSDPDNDPSDVLT